MNKNERSILVTGCSSGIGYATARGLQQRGYRVIASARKAGEGATGATSRACGRKA